MESTALHGKAFYSKVFRIALPIALQSLLTRLVDASDTLMLSVLSQDALSAISLATQAQFILNMIITAVNTVISTMAAQYWGKQDTETVDKVLAFALKVSGAVALFFFCATTFVPHLVMRIYTNDETLIALGASYLRIVGLSYLFMGISQVFLSVMKNTGRVAKSSLFGSTAVVLNLVLNALLIYGLFGLPQLGIQGAAIATVISRGVELALCLIESARAKAGSFRFSLFIRLDIPVAKQFLKLLPAILGNMVVWSFGQTMFSVIMGHLGSDAVAANSLAAILRQLAFCFCSGIGNGSAVIIGQELGADHLDTAKLYAKRLLVLAFLIGILSGMLLFALSPLVLRFTDTLSPTAQGYLKQMLFVCAFYVAGRSPNTVFVHGCFYAGGDTRFGLICDAVNLWCIVIPLGAILAFVVEAPVILVYIVLNMDELIKVPVEIIHFRKYKWLRNITKEKA